MTGLLDDQLDDGWIGPHTEDDEKTLGPFWVGVARLTWPTYGTLVVLLAAWVLIATKVRLLPAHSGYGTEAPRFRRAAEGDR